MNSHRMRARSDKQVPVWNLDAINATLAGASPRTIALWALSLRQRTIVSTSFGELSAATLHLTASLQHDVPIVWVDTGFNQAETREFAHELTQSLSLNLHVYRSREPVIQLLHRLGVSDPLDLDEASREVFVEAVKLEPFQRALDSLQPAVWITGIRADETEFRQSLAPVTLDERGILKVAPFFNASLDQVHAYLADNQLGRNTAYFDPTKAAPHLECGLHRRTVVR